MQFLDELRDLNLPSDQYAVFGSGPLAIRGLRESSDCDIIVKSDVWKELCNKYPFKEGTKDRIEIGNVEIFNTWRPPVADLNTMIDTAEVIDGIRFVRLEYVLAWKKARAKPKDVRDVQLIQHYLSGR